VHHATEAVAARSAHAAAGHHHHGDLDAHGLEWTTACDRPVALDDLTCVLCKGLNAAVVAAVITAGAPPSGLEILGASAAPFDLPRDGVSRVRGPPHLIA
jgi:hypothetical protein